MREDLKFGVEQEKRVIDLLSTKNSVVEHMTGFAFPDFDFSIDNVTYEQKTDRKTIEYGNACFEIADRGKPSGLTTTRADYWVHWAYGMGQMAIVPTEDMRKIVYLKHHRTVNCGDQNKAVCLLVRWKDIPSKYIKPVPFDKKEVKCLL